MTPTEAVEGCPNCESLWLPCDYHRGYEDGWLAAQREHGPIQAVGKPLPRFENNEKPGV